MILKWIPFFIVFNSVSQNLIYNCASDGTIFSIDKNCCRKDVCNFEAYNDIVITENGRCFAIMNSIFELDLNNCRIIQSFEPVDQFGINRVGNGLEALNDSTLITDFNDSLYLINLNTHQSTFVGHTSKFCAGDIVLKGQSIYMSTSQNEILKITMNEDFSSIISSEIIITISNLDLIYGIFNLQSNTDEMIGLAIGETLYTLNLNSLELLNYCFLENNDIFGSTSVISKSENELSKINVISPNNDGINDVIIFDDLLGLDKVSVTNRWGQEVYSCSTFPCVWRGDDNKGNILNEGVYFLRLDLEGCEFTLDSFVSSITVIK